MSPIIPKLISEGDFYLKEAKSKFFLKKEETHFASCDGCTAIKRYLDAYEQFLFEGIQRTENYHVLLHIINDEDANFKQFAEKIYEVKCFAEESKREGEKFFLFADEMNDVLNNIHEIRDYIVGEIGIKKEFLIEYLEDSFITV